nr:carcinoembryonic antigen-related cell adhesion molecule 5-like [Pseudochaenichthys georgianus]
MQNYLRGEWRLLSYHFTWSTTTGSTRLEVYAPVSNVRVTSSSTELVEFSSVSLSCSSSGSSLSFLWLNSSSEVTGSDRVQITDGGSTLTINNVMRYDQGPFRCRVSNPVSEGTSAPVTLSIYSPVSKVTVTSSSTEQVEFSSVSLSCSSSGSPLSVLWLNSSSEVTGSDRVQITDGGSTLTIANVTRYDKGPFRCHVSNPVSEGTSAPVTLSIYYGPENTIWTISPPKEHHQEGSDISLSCSADSGPPAVFKWFLNGDLLSDPGPDLSLMNVQMNQSGSYSCQAFNEKTLRYETSTPASISVLKKVSGASVTSPSNRPIEGNSFRLICDAAGSVFTREWRKGGLDLTLTVNMTLTNNNNRELSFSSLSKDHTGDYSCIISNPLSSEEAKYSMIVNYGLETVQITGPSQIHVGGTFKLTCSAASVPTVNYTWGLYYEPRTNSELSDSGNYFCEERNYITGRKSSAVHELSVTHTVPPGCSAGCIAGIVIAVLVVIGAVGGGYYVYNTK